MAGNLADVITCAKFQDEILGVTILQTSFFPFSYWFSHETYNSAARACDALRYAVTSTFDFVTLTFNLWPWTFIVYRLCRGQTLHQIWAQSSNPRGVTAISIFDLITLNMCHVLHSSLMPMTHLPAALDSSRSFRRELQQNLR